MIEVPTMATPPEESTALESPHGRSTVVAETMREVIDFGSMSTGVARASLELPEIPPFDTVTDTDAGTAPAATPPRILNKSKPKFTYSKKKLLANSSVFLRPSYRGLFTDNIVEIVGKITECPRKVNQHRYRVDW